VLLIYRNVGTQQQKKWVLLCAGLFFYGYGSLFHLLLLLGIIVTDFIVAIAIEKSKSDRKKQFLLALGIASNLGVLILFKYVGFFYQVAFMLSGLELKPLDTGLWNLVLPIGISFYTFQSIAYLLDVFKNKAKAETSFPDFLLFISFFPQLVAGPIERAAHLAPQLKQLTNPSWQVIEQGILLILYGFFKKIFIADRLSLYTEQVFGFPQLYQGPHILLANIFFTFQIYCDFSGYTDIARGTARLFGIKLMLNFNKPYLSGSFREFWSRWHISLSNWFRDVLYIPLGGSKQTKGKTLLNLGIVFFFSGLWHGAGFNYILWGCYHGLLVVVERLLQPLVLKGRLSLILKTLLVFLFISAGWLFFAVGSWDNLISTLNQLFVGWHDPYQSLNILQSKSFMLFSIAGCIGLLLWEIFEFRIKDSLKAQISNPVFRYIWLIMVIQFLAWFGQFSGKQFIYFQF
jgi:D-alanyl-lipoteichoic acid acyltransferase DltB (MBOAT superfamily)